MAGKSYTFNEKLHIWQKPGSVEFKYSDGDEVEEKIYQILKEATDLSIASDELPAAIVDWPTEYHFSKSRHNLLRHFNFSPTDEILELGCGCGSITRQLGESGARVIAVEGSQRRAMITAERCRDLPNVKVVCDNIIEYVGDTKFTIVTLIGVLEYSQLFCKDIDPVQKCLEFAWKNLTEDGVLIVAIENQLGLKYFNGCYEDHIAKPFFGINDLYQDNTPITFGKKELSARLKSAGFKQLKFFYPFPDYKLPSIIISDTGLNNDDFNVGSLLARSISRDYSKNPYRLFNENLVLQVLARNGLIGDLANSFLVIAKKEVEHGRDLTNDWLAKSYCTYRRSCFSTENTFKIGQNELIVHKRKIFPSIDKTVMTESNDSMFYHLVRDIKYTPGELYLIELYRIFARGGNMNDIVRWAMPWINFMKEKAIENGLGNNNIDLSSLNLTGRYIDCIPFNLIITKNRELVYFDDEWHSNKPIPLSWVVVRGLISALSCQNKFNNMTNRQILDMILPELGLNLDDDKYKKIAELEDSLQEFCCGRNLKGHYLAILNSSCGYYFPLFEKECENKSIIEQLYDRDRMLAEKDWQLAEREKQIKGKDEQIRQLQDFANKVKRTLLYRFYKRLKTLVSFLKLLVYGS